MTKSMLYGAILTAFVASSVQALDAAMPSQSRSSRPVSGQERQADKLASEFGVSKNEVNDLRQRGLGWGEVRQALTLSRDSGKPVEDIVRMHDDGKSWDEIAKQEGVKFDVSGRPIEKRGIDRGTRGTDQGTMDREYMDRGRAPSR